MKALSQDEQLQLQRDLIGRKNTQLTREYGALSDTTKLLFWYFLAEGMDSGSIIPMPADYKLADQSQRLFSQIQGLEFQQQISLFRDFVSPMGVDPTTAQRDPNTNL